jgi:hypothetical protein
MEDQITYWALFSPSLLTTEQIGACVHSRRATAVSNVLSYEPDARKVQEWPGHATVSTRSGPITTINRYYFETSW